MEFRRPIFSEVLDRMNEPRQFIQVLAGPRQVGKSTLMDQVLADCPLPHYLYNADGIDGIPFLEFFKMKVEELF